MAKPEQFGQIAVRMGFVATSQVQAALDIQQSLLKASQERRLIGMIMLETGMISSDQLIDILKYYDTIEEAGRRRIPASPAEPPGEHSRLPSMD